MERAAPIPEDLPPPSRRAPPEPESSAPRSEASSEQAAIERAVATLGASASYEDAARAAQELLRLRSGCAAGADAPPASAEPAAFAKGMERCAGSLVLELVPLFGVARGAAALGALFALLGALLQLPAAAEASRQGRALAAIACLLQKWTPLTEPAGPAADPAPLVAGLEALLSALRGDTALWASAQRLLALNVRIWAYAPPALQSSLLEMHRGACSASPELYRRSVSVSHVLDLCRLCYWVAEPEPGALSEEVTRGGAVCARPTESIRPLRRQLLSLIDNMMHDQPTQGEGITQRF